MAGVNLQVGLGGGDHSVPWLRASTVGHHEPTA